MKTKIIILLGILAVTCIALLLNLGTRRRAELEIREISVEWIDAEFIVYIRGENSTSIPRLNVTIIDPEGSSTTVYANYSSIGVWRTGILKPTIEGEYRIKVSLPEGGVAEKTFTFYDNPAIANVTYIVAGENILLIVEARDYTGISEVTVDVGGVRYDAEPLNVDENGNGAWKAEIPVLETLEYTVKAVDPYGNTGSIQGEICIEEIDILKGYAYTLNVNPEIVEKLYTINKTLLKELYVNHTETLSTLLKACNRNSWYIDLYRQITEDEKVDEKIETLKTALKINATPANIYSTSLLGNLSYSYTIGLPKHDHGLIRSVINACNLYPELGNFTPIIITDVLGNVVVVGSVNVTRDVWMLFEFIRRCNACGYDVLSRPEAFEAVNAKIVQNAWDILDNPYGPGYYDNVTYGPTDEGVWKVIMMQWSYYADPYFKGVNRSFYYPILDSREARMWINSSTGRKLAMMALWRIPAYAVDLESGKKVFGLKGMETFVKQPGKIYDEVMGLYPNGTVGKYNEDPRLFYYGWIIDRGKFIQNTAKQFVGISWDTLLDITHKPNPIPQIMKYNGIHQYLSKIFPKWDLVVFAYGHACWNPVYESEADIYTFGIPQTFAALGIPYTTTCINPTPLGTMPGEWAVTLPDSVVNALKQRYGDSIVIGVANTFGLYNCKDGLFKDGIKEIGQGIRRNPIYLAVKS